MAYAAQARYAGSLLVPDSLIECDQWGLWRYESRDGKPTKVPYTTRGRRASSTDPADWTDLEAALSYRRRFPKHYAGIGFAFFESDPFTGVDLDNCLDNRGSAKEWAKSIIERFGDTYMEVSPSGRGVKIWCRGKLPA